MKAIEAIKPGVRFREMGEIISTYANKHNYSVVKSYCGHGIGDLFHCAPNIPHYARNKARHPCSCASCRWCPVIFMLG